MKNYSVKVTRENGKTDTRVMRALNPENLDRRIASMKAYAESLEKAGSKGMRIKIVDIREEIPEQTTSYLAVIHYDATEDSYSDGEIGTSENSWSETLEATTAKELKAKVCEAVYCKPKELEAGDYNEYPDASEYWAGYMSDESNEGPVSKAVIELWKKGERRLWSVRCHILVSEVTKSKATL